VPRTYDPEFRRRVVEHRRTRMQRYAILATTHVQQGDLEGACAVGRQVLEEARGLSSTRTLDDVTHLVQFGQRKPSQRVGAGVHGAGSCAAQAWPSATTC
jgi:hypothetical protein